MSTQWPKSGAMKVLEVEEKKWNKQYVVDIKLKNLICDKPKNNPSCDITLKLKIEIVTKPKN